MTLSAIRLAFYGLLLLAVSACHNPFGEAVDWGNIDYASALCGEPGACHASEEGIDARNRHEHHGHHHNHGKR